MAGTDSRPFVFSSFVLLFYLKELPVFSALRPLAGYFLIHIGFVFKIFLCTGQFSATFALNDGKN